MPADKREYGHAKVEVLEWIATFREPSKILAVWMSHGDEAVELPAGFRADCQVAQRGCRDRKCRRRECGRCSFTPKFITLLLGTDILRNFVLEHLRAKPNWTPQRFIDETIASVRETVGKGRAICALSGGVDSAVAATLVDRALRDESGNSRLTCVFVNNGVLRKNEFEKVQKTCATNSACM